MKGVVTQLPLKPRKLSVAPRLDGDSPRPPLTTAGLFAGIGGIELGLGRSEHPTALACEIDVAANAVLDDRFRGIRRAKDVCSLKGLPRGTNLLAAGFPCQDLSQAGKTRGIDGSRSSLIAEALRLVEKSRVEWVLLENVPFMLQLGRGHAVDVILCELERLGYKWAYRVVNSRSFGIPQRRERVYFLASRQSDPRDVLFVDDATEPIDHRSFREVACGFYWTEGVRGLGWAIDAVPTLKGGSTIGIPSPPAIIFPSGRIAKPDIRDAERLQGFAPDWTVPAERVARPGVRWKLVGNAVTVDVVAWIGARLRNPGEYDATGDLLLRTNQRWPSAAYNVGDGRFASHLSTWPVQTSSPPLEGFLRYEAQDLSERATAGFLARAESATLRFPPGFLAAVRAHLSRLRDEPLHAII